MNLKLLNIDGSKPETIEVSDKLINLKVNGVLKQEGDLNQMIWKVPEMISYLPDYFGLSGGDVILSGTPAGVGPVCKGDTMEVSANGLGILKVLVI